MRLTELKKKIEELNHRYMNTRDYHTLQEINYQLRGIKQVVDAVDYGELDFIWKGDNLTVWNEIKKLLKIE